jgi:hypothetical protein
MEAMETNNAKPVQLGAQTAPPSKRYHGLDGARTAAMLLDVFFHLPIAMMGGFGLFGGAACEGTATP